MLPSGSASCVRFAYDAVVSDSRTAELRLDGEIDLADCPSIVAAVEQLARSGCCRVRIDLGAVTFIDAAAVGAFVRLHAQGRNNGCEVVLTSVRGFPLRVLRLLSLEGELVEGGGDG